MIIVVAFVLVSLLVLMVASHVLLSPSNTGSDGSDKKIMDHVGNYTIAYSWTYPYDSHKIWTINVTIPKSTYADYVDKDRTTEYASYVTENDAVIERIAQELRNDSVRSGYDTAQFVLSFVQSIPYGTDENTTGLLIYPRYPIQTLVDDVGDCKDHSTLYASLLESSSINDDVVLFELLPQQGVEGHMAVGLASQGYLGNYIQYQGLDYFYCETTSSGWLIGEMPPEFSDYTIRVLSS